MNARIWWEDVPNNYRKELSNTKVVKHTRILVGLCRWRKRARVVLLKRKGSLVGEASTPAAGEKIVANRNRNQKATVALAEEEVEGDGTPRTSRKGILAMGRGGCHQQGERWAEGDITYEELFKDVLSNFEKLSKLHQQELLRVPTSRGILSIVGVSILPQTGYLPPRHLSKEIIFSGIQKIYLLGLTTFWPLSESPRIGDMRDNVSRFL